MEKLVIWSHGSDAKPWGNKSQTLAETAKQAGFEFEAVDFTDLPGADDRVTRLQAVIEEKKPAVLAGSSMGGYVSAVSAMNTPVAGVFLVAPAFYLPGYETHMFNGLPPIVDVIHGWKDDVVPVENSIRFARLHGATLHALEGDHRLSGLEGEVASIFATFLSKLS